MTKFIMLTESMSNGDTQLLLLNTAYITHVQGRLTGRDTHIRMSILGHEGKQLYYFVKESAEEIWKLINTDSTKAPMTADEALKYYSKKEVA